MLGGRYTLTERIAGGGMGEVWQATDPVLHRTVAVKLLRPGLGAEHGFTERFRAEARHAASLTHPGIAAVHDYGEDEGSAYLVMEYVAGEPLSRIIATRAPLPADEVTAIVRQAAAALEAAHVGGVVHRDVKPANIIITPDGTAKLTDFGISRALGALPLTRTGEVMGTAQYLAPEQAVGRGATGSSDLYALGVVAFEMLTGTRPFDAETAVATALAHVNEAPPPLPATVPEPLRSTVEACLAKDPADRPPSAEALVAALGMPAGAVPETARLSAPGASDPTQVLPVAPAGDTRSTDTAPQPGPASGGTGAAASGASGRRRALVWLVVAVVAVLLAGYGVWTVAEGSPGRPSPSPQASTPATPPAVVPQTGRSTGPTSQPSSSASEPSSTTPSTSGSSSTSPSATTSSGPSGTSTTSSAPTGPSTTPPPSSSPAPTTPPPSGTPSQGTTKGTP